jgi:hypothetical protein
VKATITIAFTFDVKQRGPLVQALEELHLGTDEIIDDGALQLTFAHHLKERGIVAKPVDAQTQCVERARS